MGQDAALAELMWEVMQMKMKKKIRGKDWMVLDILVFCNFFLSENLDL